MNRLVLALALASPLLSSAAMAQEAFAGVYAHAVDTPFTLNTGEHGVDVAAGFRFAPIRALHAIGSPAPYVVASLNTGGDTSFAGLGMAWTIGKGAVYVRPGVALVVHDGPGFRVDLARTRTDLGSRVLFEPEIALGVRVDRQVSLEASWMHISQGRIFNRDQNPGIDMIGARVNYRL
jgi:hypothetical protein